MAVVLQLTRRLVERPQPRPVEGISLRHYAGPADIDLWLALRRRGFARQQLGVGNWERADFEREFLAKDWWRPETMWFAEAQAEPNATEPVGTVTLARRGHDATARPVVHWLIVLSGYRRRGIGRLLLTTLEAALWDAGGRQVWLETHSAWSEALALYQTLGYRPAHD